MTTRPSMAIVCASHLAWEQQLFQRPQQIMTRLARRGHRVHYLARWSTRRWWDATRAENHPTFADTGTASNLPWLPLAGRFPAVNRLSLSLVESRARDFIRKHRQPGQPLVLWLQHPDFLPLARIPGVDVLVYDCMDPFGAFRTSRPNVVAREDALLARADVVFTGGRSLHELVAPRCAHARCLSSGIDIDHFRRARSVQILPPDIARTSAPRLGYVGAIDERIDWDLLYKIVRERPHWTIVLVGPLLAGTRIPFTASNLVWLGARPYDELPDILAGFDVALIPWKVNELTRYMSPTKTPEYLLAGCPVVGVPIPDVAADYTEGVWIADSADAFIAACEQALQAGLVPESAAAPAQTWDAIAETMERAIIKKLG